MICPKCGHLQPDGSGECVHCGVIFAKVRLHTSPAGSAPTPSPTGESSPLSEMLFAAPTDEPQLFVAGRGLFLAAILIWGVRLIAHPPASNFSGESFLHLVNLPFHEAGHIIFSPFGRFIGVFGGSLMQLLIPLVVIIAFISMRNPFAASVGLWWFGESFIDLGPYINDARAGQLMLVGGVTGSEVEDYHDWENILRTVGWLHHDHALGWAAHLLGSSLMLGALLWGGCVVWRQYLSIKR